jgi:predicted RNA-binding Zn-ribbon protein involved in translation (DUF1610 family)
MFEQKEEKTFTCSSCESEFSITELYSEHQIRYCPFCSDQIVEDEE